ncbi:MAG: transcription termination/antitermination NusG family protein, partial [Alphaproteobacteria bacterium]
MAMRWYIIHAYSGFEKKVAQAIQDDAARLGMEDLFEEILVPVEEVVQVRRGKKVSSERKFFPGYVLAKMEMTDGAYHLVKDNPKVTGFLGTGTKPLPITDREAQQILSQVKEGVDRPRPSVTFEVG